MSDDDSKPAASNTEPQEQPESHADTTLPQQSSPQDTSNWDDRPFTTPTDRIVIETYDGDDRIPVQE